MPAPRGSVSDPAPGARSRLVGIDLARAVALLGMVATHTLASRGDDGSLSLSHQIASGRASALFAVLAGVSLALISGRNTPPRGEARWDRSLGVAIRAALIAATGLTLGMLDSGLAIILTNYGLLFLLALPFLGLGARPLFALAGIWMVVAPVVSQVVRPALPARGFDSPAWGQLASPSHLISELAFTGYYPVFAWLSYALLGMGIGRLRLERPQVQLMLAASGTLLALLAKASSALATAQAGVRRRLAVEQQVRPDSVLDQIAEGLSGRTPDGSWSWLLVDAPHSSTPFDLVATGGSAMAVIAVSLLFVGTLSSGARRIVAIVFGMGAMTLTLYTVHVFLRTERVWPPDEGTSAFVAHAAVLVIVGACFAALHRRGPLEAVTHRVVAVVARRRRRLSPR